MLIVETTPGSAPPPRRSSAPALALVAGELATGEQAVDRIGSAGAALVLMDIGMPGLGGVEATRASGPPIRRW